MIAAEGDRERDRGRTHRLGVGLEGRIRTGRLILGPLSTEHLKASIPFSPCL